VLLAVVASEAKQSSETRADWIASSQELLAMTRFKDYLAVGLQRRAAGLESSL
jgi:hypothetical protein